MKAYTERHNYTVERVRPCITVSILATNTELVLSLETSVPILCSMWITLGPLVGRLAGGRWQVAGWVKEGE